MVDARARVAQEVNALTRHWELKLLALVFAFALWLYVVTSEKSDIVVTAPGEFDGVPSGLVIASAGPDTVDVQLHGLRGNLSRVAPDQLRVRVNVAGAAPGDVTLRVLPEHVTVPPGINFLRVNPAWIRLMISAPTSPRGEPTKEAPRS
jgi:hypothetical protein